MDKPETGQDRACPSCPLFRGFPVFPVFLLIPTPFHEFRFILVAATPRCVFCGEDG